MSRFNLICICGLMSLIAVLESRATTGIGPSTQNLEVRDEPGRVVLSWSGPISQPMRDRVVAAIDRYKADTRRLVIALNSPGGSIAHGREVIAAIREASHRRPIDTLVEDGGVCASMCVPIYLIGAVRIAHPAAHFMFHEAGLDLPAGNDVSKGELERSASARKAIENLATDDLFQRDIATQRVNARWLAEMRTKIIRHEIWLTGRQLVSERSGVVDALVSATAK
jgi:ATP-dependent protease ClpP protease subunit